MYPSTSTSDKHGKQNEQKRNTFEATNLAKVTKKANCKDEAPANTQARALSFQR